MSKRARGLAAWQPRAGSLALLEQVNAVLLEYADHLPLTIRQIFYRLVGAHGYDKTERAYDRLGEMLNRARRAGFVRFDAIRDDGVDMRVPTAWDDAEHLVGAIRSTITNFRLDRQRGQARRLLVAVEAAGMLPQVVRITAPYGIPVQSSGGFDSLTAKHALAEFLSEWPAAEVLHIGDHDPSGVHVFSSLAEDVRAICADREHDVDVAFTRLCRNSVTDRCPRPADGASEINRPAPLRWHRDRPGRGDPARHLGRDHPARDRRSPRRCGAASGAERGSRCQDAAARSVRRAVSATARLSAQGDRVAHQPFLAPPGGR